MCGQNFTCRLKNYTQKLIAQNRVWEALKVLVAFG